MKINIFTKTTIKIMNQLNSSNQTVIFKSIDFNKKNLHRNLSYNHSSEIFAHFTGIEELK